MPGVEKIWFVPWQVRGSSLATPQLRPPPDGGTEEEDGPPPLEVDLHARLDAVAARTAEELVVDRPAWARVGVDRQLG